MAVPTTNSGINDRDADNATITNVPTATPNPSDKVKAGNDGKDSSDGINTIMMILKVVVVLVQYLDSVLCVEA